MITLFSIALAAPTLMVSPLTAGAPAEVRGTGMTAGQELWLHVSTQGPGSGPCRGQVCLDIRNPQRVGRAVAGPNGVASVFFDVPLAAQGKELAFQAVVPGAGEVSDVALTLVGAAPVVRELVDADAVLTGDVGDELGNAFTLSVTDIAGVPTLPCGTVHQSRRRAHAHAHAHAARSARGSPGKPQRFGDNAFRADAQLHYPGALPGGANLHCRHHRRGIV